MILIGSNVIIFLCIAAACGAAAAAFIVYRINKNNPNSKMNVLAAGIRMNAVQFSGMYEPLYAVSMGTNPLQREVFAAWHERVFACDEDNGFKAIYTKMFGDYQHWSQKGGKKALKCYMKKAKKLLKVCARAGVIREQEGFVTGSENTLDYYELVGSDVVAAGAVYEVMTPYWHLGETVLDRGVIRFR